MPGYHKVKAIAAKVLSMLEATYLCKQFSVMNNNKTKQRSRLTNKLHLNDIAKCAATQDLTRNIDALVKAKRSRVLGPAAASSLQ